MTDGALVPRETLGLETADTRVARYVVAAKSEGTKRAYRSAWNLYESWCGAANRQPLDGNSATVVAYLTELADRGLAVSYIRGALAAIKTAYDYAEVPFTLSRQGRAVLQGIARTRGTRPLRQAAPAVPDVLRRLLAVCLPETDALGARDRCMLLLGFGAALRRSELVALRVADVTLDPRGLVVLIRRSKTDQEGKGRQIMVWANEADRAFCPRRAFDAWMAFRMQVGTLKNLECPLFMAVSRARRLHGAGLSDKAVARLIKVTAEAAGLDVSRYSGHSLRSGLATAAGEAGLLLPNIMRQTRHKTVEAVLGYMRPSDAWRDNVTETLFKWSTHKEIRQL